MGKLMLSIVIGALLSSFAAEWDSGSLSANQVLAAVKDTGLALLSMVR